MKIDFYNFQRIPFDAGLVKVVQKAYDSGEKIFIKTKDKTASEVIDKLLWEFENKNWLPHGTKKPEYNPIYINHDYPPKENGKILIITDCSDIPLDMEFSRCLYIFNGNNQDDLNIARSQYKQSLAKKLELQYHNL